MEAGATHTTVRDDVRFGMPDDPPEAGFQGAKEGVAETLASQLVPRKGLVDVELGVAPNSTSGASPRPMPDALALQPPDAASQE